MQEITVVDYDAGNITSLERALVHLGHAFERTSDPKRIESAERLVIPGVGQASHIMAVMRERGLDSALRSAVAAGVPTLGICIGCQVVLEYSAENDTELLGIIPGRVEKFAPACGNINTQQKKHEDTRLKVPQIGWNAVHYKENEASARLFAGIPQDSSFYFVNSYYPAPRLNEHALAWTDYGLNFASVIGKQNLVACQFHPEKSGELGLRLLDNFIRKF